jgi:hypothetical protein
MNVNLTNVNNGVKMGTQRARQHFQNLSLNLDGQSRDLIETILGWWPNDLHDDFVELFIELATLASITRISNQEPLLTKDELAAYLAHSASFFNSFKHK